MKKLFAIFVLSILFVTFALSADENHTVRIVAGIGTDVVISFGATNQLIRAIIDYPTNEFVIVKGTNITFCLNIGSDGAVYGIKADWGYIDMITHLVNQDTGKTNICNPLVVFDGKTNDIIQTWLLLNKHDARFTIKDDRKESNKELKATRETRAPKL